MRYFVSVLFCGIAMLAQTQVLEGARAASAPILRPGATTPAVQAARIAQVAHITRLQPLRPIIFQPIVPLAEPKFVKITNAPAPINLQQYHQVLLDAEKLRQGASSFLYYQSQPSQSHPLSVQEKNYWLDKILPLRHRLLTAYHSTEQDPALSGALDYTTYFACIVDPTLTHVLPPKENAKPTREQPSVPENFFLYPQPGAPLPDPFVDLENKLIVIVNDSSSLIDFFEKYYHYGVLFPEAKLSTHSGVSDFLLWYQAADIKPDIVFTDMQLGDSSGRHLAGELRRMGFEGGIIALTSYTETPKMARDLFLGGFDGMVSIAPQYLGKIPVFQRITQAAQVYYQQKARSKQNR